MQKTETEQHTLDKCPVWVRQHSDWKQPWNPAGRAQALAEINGWNAEYAPQLRDENPTPPLKGDDPLVSRLWNCLVNHWESAGHGRSHGEIVKKLKVGVGPDSRDLGGNPLFGIVLCVALCDDQKTAKDYFLKQILPEIYETAEKIFLQRRCEYRGDWEEEVIHIWEEDFRDYLTKSSAQSDYKPLDSYRGWIGIVPWLRQRLAWFFRDRFRSKKYNDDKPRGMSDDLEAAQRLNSIVSSGLNSHDTTADQEEKALLKKIITKIQEEKTIEKTWQTLTSDERLRIGYCYGAEHQNKHIASLFNEKEYQTTRERKKAENRFKVTFCQLFEEKVLSDSAIFDNLPQLTVELTLLLDKIKEKGLSDPTLFGSLPQLKTEAALILVNILEEVISILYKIIDT